MTSMDNYKHKAITSTMYSSGLRVSEVCHLRYEDIRRKQRMIHVPLSKNRQDRYTILSDRNLDMGGTVIAVNAGERMQRIRTMSGIYKLIDIYEGMPDQMSRF